MWRETTLLTDRAVQFATAKNYVFSDSMLFLGGVSTEPVQGMGKQDLMVFGNTAPQIFGWDRRRADGVRVDKILRIH